MHQSSRERKLQKIILKERELSSIKDLDVLLERILTESRSIVRADAGSIYVVEDDKLKIKYAQNDTQQKKLPKGTKLPYVSFSFPITEESLAGYCVLSGKILNIADVYNLPKNVPYSFNMSSDLKTGYKSHSMLVVPLKMANGRVLGVLQIINARNRKGDFVKFTKDGELYIAHFATNATQVLEHAYLTSNMVMRMQRMAEFRDPKETFHHVERVSSFSIEIYDRWAENKEISERERKRFRDNLKIAAKCHDFGKIGISDMILKKTGAALTEEERNIMKGHTCMGALIFTETESELDEMCRDVALYHHEWWNGSEKGYPGKLNYREYKAGTPVECQEHLSGDEIPLSARIVAIADVFDALSHKRIYKAAWSVEESFSEIQNLSGTQFDPELVEAFMQIKDRLIAINSVFESTVYSDDE